MEATRLTPPLATYTHVISSLFRRPLLPRSRETAWDLYARCRLVSHPVPDVPLYNVAISACGSSPERALDLFLEMQSHKLQPNLDTFNSLFLVLCRKQSGNYWEALNLLGQMVERGVQPNSDTFARILVGARANGDLGRTRWILSRMNQTQNPPPDAETLAMAFNVYADFRPKAKENAWPSVLGALPANSREVREEVKRILASHVEFGETDLIVFLDGLEKVKPVVVLDQKANDEAATSAEAPPPAPVPHLFERIQRPVLPTSKLAASVLAVYAVHAPFDSFVSLFDQLVPQFALDPAVGKPQRAYQLALRTAEKARDRGKALEFAERVFREWRGTREASSMSPRSIERMWSTMIRIYAKCVGASSHIFFPLLV
jgi:hypothetical protein